jgi:hemerythrin superfamily protein
MDATRLLEQDHRTVEELFVAFEEATGDSEEKERIARDITRELSIHASIEEQVFYPAVRASVTDGEDLVDHSLDEHQEVKELLADIEKMSGGDPGFHQKVEAVIRDVREHVEEEEGEMFPRLREAITAARLEEIGKALQTAKASAPTRPHPHAPNQPPGNLVAGPGAAIVDRVRDAFSDRDAG